MVRQDVQPPTHYPVHSCYLTRARTHALSLSLSHNTDRWRSTLHRVIVKGIQGARRQSIAYFCNVNGDCLVDPRDLIPDETPHYPPITAWEHLIKKHLASMGHEEKEE